MLERPFDHYLPFSIADFLTDEEFQAWVLHPTPERSAYWQAFLLAFPHKEQATKEARKAILALRPDWESVDPYALHQRFAELQTQLDADAEPTTQLPARRLWQRANWRWGAAASVVLTMLITGLYQYGWADQIYRSTYGQRRTVQLTDQTTVQLAPNSQLRVPGPWAFTRQREVWLGGEAFFVVTKQRTGNTGHTFVVHTPHLDVQVLGTRFNVNTNRGKTTVFLAEGNVRLKPVGSQFPEAVMRPGEVAEQLPHRQLQVAPAPNRDPLAWTRNQLIFREAPLTEVAQRVEEIYGLRLVFDGPGWANITYTGTLPTNDIALLTTLLGETLQARSLRQSEALIFELNKP